MKIYRLMEWTDLRVSVQNAIKCVINDVVIRMGIEI